MLFIYIYRNRNASIDQSCKTICKPKYKLDGAEKGNKDT